MVWRAPIRARDEDGAGEAWLYLVMMLEFQSEVDFLMALHRMTTETLAAAVEFVEADGSAGEFRSLFTAVGESLLLPASNPNP